MNSLVLAVIGIAMMVAGYLLYSKFLGRRIFRLSPNYSTPAHTMEDGVDYVPTNKYVLWGHHFTSVAGAAPIIGPAVAVIWGWVPAFLWVTIGTIFFAGLHDLGALWASQRHKGQSIGTLSGRYIGKRGRNLFLIVIFLLLLMVNTAFAVVISNLLVSTPMAVIPTWGAIAVALLIGQAIYRLKWNLPLVSIVGVIALYALMIIGDRVPVVLPDTVLGIPANGVWIILLFIYAFIASMLPVWVLLQPRDGTPGIFPLLFVTIACGAVSGFHGVVASGTSSKQVDNETDVRFVGYFGAVGEGLLALGTIIATTAGFKTAAQWEEIYSEWNAGGVDAFVQGGGALMNEGLGIPTSLSGTILATMAVLFAATTMDSGVRLQRLVVQEIGEIIGVRIKALAATVIAVGLAFGLTFSAGVDGSGGMTIWPLFGTTNQLMAGLSLAIVVVILTPLRRPTWPVVFPLIFVTAMSLWAALLQLKSLFTSQNWLLFCMDAIIVVATIWVIVEAVGAISRARKEAPLEWSDDDLDAPLPEHARQA